MNFRIIATLAAFFVKGLCGFASSLVFSTILSFGINNINITPVDLLLKIFFGAVIICMGCGMLSGKDEKEDEDKNRSENGKGGLKPGYIFLGIASGVLCGMYGIGALLAVYVSRVTNNSREFKATICMAYIVDNIFRFILYVATEIITLQVVRQAVLLLPFMLIGLFAGMKSSRYMEGEDGKAGDEYCAGYFGCGTDHENSFIIFSGLSCYAFFNKKEKKYRFLLLFML